jgi:hypothetical protein
LEILEVAREGSSTEATKPVDIKDSPQQGVSVSPPELGAPIVEEKENIEPDLKIPKVDGDGYLTYATKPIDIKDSPKRECRNFCSQILMQNRNFTSLTRGFLDFNLVNFQH